MKYRGHVVDVEPDAQIRVSNAGELFASARVQRLRFCVKPRIAKVATALILTLAGCGPSRTPYPASLNSNRPEERILAAKHAAEIHDRDVIGILVDRLEDDDEAVRMFAILALEKLTGTRHGYDYAADQTERQRAVQRWRRYVAQQGASSGPTPGGYE